MLEHPLTRDLSVDDPHTTNVRRGIIRHKQFLRQIYVDWYRTIAAQVPAGAGPVLEIGSGAGFMDEYIPGLITSEVFRCTGIDVVLDGQRLPFPDRSLRAIVMADVLHHLPTVRYFFSEAGRCVRSGGAIVMIEPWMTPWSRLVYRYLHPEPLQTDTPTWEFPSSGPLSGANIALPWILFERDRQQFEAEFPDWHIQPISLMMPFRYLLSGGLTQLTFMPGWTTPTWQRLEHDLQPWMPTIAMFALIVLTRR